MSCESLYSLKLNKKYPQMLLARATNENQPSLTLRSCGANIIGSYSHKDSIKKIHLHTLVGQSNMFL